MLKKAVSLFLLSVPFITVWFAITAVPVHAQYTVLTLHDWLPSTHKTNIHRASDATSVSNNRIIGTVRDLTSVDVGSTFLWDLTNHTAIELRPQPPPHYDGYASLSLAENRIVGIAGDFKAGRYMTLFWDIPKPIGNSLTLNAARRTDYVTALSGEAKTFAGSWAVGCEMEENFTLQTLWDRLLFRQEHHGASWHELPLLWNMATGEKWRLPLPQGTTGSLSGHAVDIWGDSVVGVIVASPYPDQENVCVWNLRTGETTNLHPLLSPEVYASHAVAIQGDWICGTITPFRGADESRAVVWNLSSRNAVELHAWLDTNYFTSTVAGISGRQVAGTATATSVNPMGMAAPHAFLWDLNTRTAINLHEKYLKAAGYTTSITRAIATNGVIVGTGERNKRPEVWALIPTLPRPPESEPPTTLGVWASPSNRFLPLAAMILLLMLAITVLFLIGKRRRPRV